MLVALGRVDSQKTSRRVVGCHFVRRFVLVLVLESGAAGERRNEGLKRGPIFSRSIPRHSNIASGRSRGRGRVREGNTRCGAIISTLRGLGSMVKYIGFLALHSQ